MVWHALLHRPGPGLDRVSVFEHPAFLEHLTFVRRLQADGMLVAAGPCRTNPARA